MTVRLNESSSSRAEIGVVVTAHGADSLVLETLDSLAGQSVPPSAVFVVFDGPIPLLHEAVESHPAVTELLVLDHPSGGPATPRNAGFHVIRDRTEAVCFLDHDDIVHPDFILVVAELLATHAHASLFALDFEQWDHGTPRVSLSPPSPSPIPTHPLSLNDYLAATGSVLPSFTVIRNEIASSVRDAGTIFDADFPSNQDYEAFVRVLAQHQAVRCEWKGGWYRLISTSISANGAHSWACRAKACERLAGWFAARGDSKLQSRFKRSRGSALRTSARHKWVQGHRLPALAMLGMEFLRRGDVRYPGLMVALMAGLDSRSARLSGGDARSAYRSG